MTREPIVIANCGGFWGDDPTAARRQVEGGPVDYLVMDYLAEVTMAILQKQRQKHPEQGYAHHFLTQMRDVLPACAEKGIRIISNAGGVNPLQCGVEIERLAEELGIADRVQVGVVLGDDIFGKLDGLLATDEPLRHMASGRPLAEVRDQVLSANVYLGAAPVVRALEMGANVVVTGRVTDTAVTLAPMIHEFGWAADDWDKLAAGVVAGHIIECGTQCTGGNFTDWHTVPSFRNMGFPLVEGRPDGSFVITKHPGTGGLVTTHTVSEQLLYEMGSPEYVSPDCTARFDSIRLEQDGADRVRVFGVRGGPAPERLKVSISYNQGYRAFGRLMVGGPDALRKAKKLAEVFWESAGGRAQFQDSLTQFIGWDSCRPTVDEGDPPEILVQLAVRDDDRRKILANFSSQIVPKVLSSIPGVTYLADQGFPHPSTVVGYWPALIDREHVPLEVRVGDQRAKVPPADASSARPEPFEARFEVPPAPSSGRTRTVPLSHLCLGRSGDKGDTCNVGLIARSAPIYAWMRDVLTPDFVQARFAEVCAGGVERHELPNLLALNFLLHGSLGGGGTLSLLLDAQGKTYAQFLLAAEVEADEALLETIR